MSLKIELPKNPRSHPDLFVKVPTKEVQAGDIFQGTKGRTGHLKWYQNTTGQACVDENRTYWRPKDAATATVLGIKPPVKAEFEDAESGDSADEPVMTITWHLNAKAIKRLLAEINIA